MKKHFLVFFLVTIVLLSGCEETNVELAAEAGIDAIKAVTLRDRDVQLLARKASRHSDSKNRIAGPNNHYTIRLNRLTGSHVKSNGYDFNIKVYLSPQINAFAMSDGTIRIYSGLMDILNDKELLFVIGHEMGHIIEKHVKKKIMMAYAARSIRKGIASQENIAGDIARSTIGGVAETLMNTQFSQTEEKAADDFGILFLKKHGYEITAAVSALQKLDKLGNQHTIFSSHPDPGLRAKRMQEQIDSPDKIGGPSMFEKILTRIKRIFSA